MMLSFFISCSKGLEYLLADELSSLGFQQTKVSPNGVYGSADLEIIYRVCVWSRLANRIQLILFNSPVSSIDDLYQCCATFPWETVFLADRTFAIDFHGTSDLVRNTMFGAQIVKDGVADYFRNLSGVRPLVDRAHPQVRIHAYLKNEIVSVRFDLIGYSLHQRGYRLAAGSAPIKETLAVAMLLRAKWPEIMEQSCVLHDPFCGSGTIVIEAAMMAARIAPGLLREDQSVHNWVGHDHELWEQTRQAARQQQCGLTEKLSGTDCDPSVVSMANENAMRAGVQDYVAFSAASIAELPTRTGRTGLVIANPPYGERLGDPADLIPLYKKFGQSLHANYPGWHAAFLTSNILLAKATGLRSHQQYKLYNGALECKLYCINLNAAQVLRDASSQRLDASTQMFANRLKKNQDHLQKWARRHQVSCYRVYDADLPEYAFAIDCYNDHVVLQEYAAPALIPAELVEKRRAAVIQAVPLVLGVSAHQVILKERKPQKGASQYQKLSQTQHGMIVSEGRAKFNVNLHDYLDTGLFLDHRLLRQTFGKLPAGTRFLNCFCYTATASVHAALAGAFTTNVDLSQTYLTWAEEHFHLNGLDLSRHQFVHYDCLEWLKVTRDQFDVIFLDPPSFSNSKRMQETLDIQRDHAALIHAAMRLLTANGVLYFSTNLRSFKLSPEILEQYVTKDISAQTIDVDFKRNQRIHQCFTLVDRV